jgi:hypothetical protein
MLSISTSVGEGKKQDCLEGDVRLQCIHKKSCQAWWCTPAIPAFGRLRPEDFKFNITLGYMVRPCLNNNNNDNNTHCNIVNGSSLMNLYLQNHLILAE